MALQLTLSLEPEERDAMQRTLISRIEHLRRIIQSKPSARMTISELGMARLKWTQEIAHLQTLHDALSAAR